MNHLIFFATKEYANEVSWRALSLPLLGMIFVVAPGVIHFDEWSST